MINLHLTRADNYEGVYLRLPATPAEIGETFGRLDKISEDVASTKLVDATCPVRNLWRYIKNTDVSDSENITVLNELSRKISGMDIQQQAIFSGALDAESINGLPDILRVADSLDEYVLIEDISSDRELGGYLIEHGYLEVPERLQPYMDHVGIGSEYYAEHGGAYTLNGYILRKSSLDPYLEPRRDAVFRVSLQGPLAQEPYLLILPAFFERMAQVKQTLGVDHIADAEITKIECTIPYLENLIPFAEADIRRLDELAEVIADMRSADGELLKFCAVLEVEQPETIPQAYKLACDLDNYERITEGTYEYGQSVLRRHGAEDELLQAMEGYMDFEKLGEDAMIEDGVRETEFGLIRRLSKPFPEQGYEQTMG